MKARDELNTKTVSRTGKHRQITSSTFEGKRLIIEHVLEVGGWICRPIVLTDAEIHRLSAYIKAIEGKT